MIDRFLSETVHIPAFRYHFSEMLMVLLAFAFLFASPCIAVEDSCQNFAAVGICFYAYGISIHLASVSEDTSKGFLKQIIPKMLSDSVKDSGDFKAIT